MPVSFKTAIWMWSKSDIDDSTNFFEEILSVYELYKYQITAFYRKRIKKKNTYVHLHVRFLNLKGKISSK